MLQGGTSHDALAIVLGAVPTPSVFASLTGGGSKLLDQAFVSTGFMAGLALLAFEESNGYLPDYVVLDVELIGKDAFGFGGTIAISKSGRWFSGPQIVAGMPGATSALRLGSIGGHPSSASGLSGAEVDSFLEGGPSLGFGVSVNYTNWTVTIPAGQNNAYALENGWVNAPLGISGSLSYTWYSGWSTPGWG